MKRILCCLFAYLLSQAGNSQSIDVLEKQYQLYMREAKHDSAMMVLERIVEATKKIKGAESAEYGGILNYAGTSYFKLEKYEKAAGYFDAAMVVLKKNPGEGHAQYEQSLLNLVYVYEILNSKKLEETYNYAANRQKRLKGEDSVYTDWLDRLAVFYYQEKLGEKEERLYKDLIGIKKRVFGLQHSSYIKTVRSLANLYFDQGMFTEALPLFLEIHETRKKITDKSEDYVKSIFPLADTYYELNDYTRAAQYYQQAVTAAKLLGRDHPLYSSALTNAGIFFQAIGRTAEAESSFKEVIVVEKEVGGKNSKRHALALDNLASLYLDLGNVTEAENLLLESIEIRQFISDTRSLEFAISYDFLGVLYKQLGQYEKAEEYLLRACELMFSNGGETENYAISQNNLALVYLQMSKLDKAEHHLRKAADLAGRFYGQNSLGRATCLHNLGVIYSRKGEFDRSFAVMDSAFAIRKNKLKPDHPDMASSYLGLSQLYARKHQFKEAIDLGNKALVIFQQTMGEYSGDYLYTLTTLVSFYGDNDQPHLAEPLIMRHDSLLTRKTLQEFSLLSDREKGSYVTNTITALEMDNSLIYKNKRSSPAMLRNSYDLLLLFKSLALADTRNMIATIQHSKDSGVVKTFREWRENKTQLARQYGLPLEKQMTNLAELEASTEELERKLNRVSAEFRSQQGSLLVKSQSVQQHLGNDEAAIEFVKFMLYDQGWTDSIFYAAYILRKEGPPQFVPLCEEWQIQRLFDSAGTNTTSMVNSFYRGLEIKNKNATLGKELYKLVWEPMEPYLQNIKEVSYSPAGKLYSIAFHALAVDSNRLLTDRYRMRQYSSTREIGIRSDEQQMPPSSVVLFGDPVFTMDAAAMERNKKEHTVQRVNVPTRGEQGIWNALPGTADEIKKIAQLFQQNKISTQSYDKEQASEENLKALESRSPQVLHIATHGFFLPIPAKERREPIQMNSYMQADDPLIRSGLVFAGANHAWSGKSPIEGVEDGIATAYEISQLNLSNTELVVLSACETALGDVKGSEGVFGLQRAFKMAGVKKMILSLWQVPDKETAELMTAFYTYWMKGKTITESFQQAQADMRKKYSPFYWAAFVLVE